MLQTILKKFTVLYNYSVSRTKYENIRLGILISIFGFTYTSLYHTIPFWGITNPSFLSILIPSLLSVTIFSAVLGAKYSKWSYIIVISLFILEFVANIFYSYNTISPNSEKYVSWTQFLAEFGVPFLTKKVKIITAVVTGGIIPTFALVTFHYYLFMQDVEPKKPKKRSRKRNIVKDTPIVDPQAILSTPTPTILELDDNTSKIPNIPTIEPTIPTPVTTTPPIEKQIENVKNVTPIVNKHKEFNRNIPKKNKSNTIVK